MATIHEILENGAIVANDEALDILFSYDDEGETLTQWQGNTNGVYEVTDTRRDVDDDDDVIAGVVEDMLGTPD